MTKRFDNKRLLFILAGLAVILLLTFLINKPKEHGTLREKMADFDTSSVEKIIIHPKAGKGEPFELERKDNRWYVKQGDVISPSVNGEVDNMMGEVLGIRPQSLASVSKTRWKDFGLTDSLASRVEFFDKRGKVLSDIMFGKMNYSQAGNSQYAGYGGNNLHVTSYVRLHNEKDIYAVDGFVSFTFNTGFDDWRDKTLIITKTKDLTGITFSYPADSSFMLVKNGNNWTINGQKADSSKVAGYINSLAVMNGGKIADKYIAESEPVYKMNVTGNNGLDINLDCYTGKKPDEYILHSSINPDLYFSAKWENLPGRLFRTSSYFLMPPAVRKR